MESGIGTEIVTAEVLRQGELLLPLTPTETPAPAARAPLFAKETPDAAALPLENRRYEQFCQYVVYKRADGTRRTFGEAYADAFARTGRAPLTPATARANASRLRHDHPEIDKRIAFLDRELKKETLLHAGSTFADTVNKLVGVCEAMDKHKSSPKHAAVLVSAAGLLLKATGNETPEMRTVTEIQQAAAEVPTADALGNVRALLTRITQRKETIE